MRNRIFATAGVSALLIALVGCGPEASGGTYESVEDLRDAFVNAGGECEDWNQDNSVLGAAQSGTCGPSVVLSTYLSHDAVQERIAETKDSIFGGIGGEWLTGENWIINSDNTVELKNKLGGQVVSFADDG